MITAGDMLLLIVKFSKSTSCGNVTSVDCVPLVKAILSERTTIEEGKYCENILDRNSLVAEVQYKFTRYRNCYNTTASPMFLLDRRMSRSLVFRDKAVAR